MKFLLPLLALIGVPLLIGFFQKGAYEERLKPELISSAKRILTEQKVTTPTVSVEKLDATITGLVASHEKRDQVGNMIDGLHGLRLPESNNLLKVQGWIKATKHNGEVTLSGVLPSDLKLEQVFPFPDGQGDRIDHTALEFKDHVTRPQSLITNGWHSWITDYFQKPGDRSLSVKGKNISLEGIATPFMQREWLLKLQDLGFNPENHWTLHPSIYHFPNYQVTSKLPQEKLLKLRQELKLSNIYFDTASATVADEELPKIDRIANAILSAGSEVKYIIGGHADITGNAEMNTRLSKQRSLAVIAQLAMRGVNPNIFEIIPFGASKASGNANADRRVEVLVK